MAGAVSGLAASIYRYDPERHDLTMLEEGDRRHDLAATALDQEWLAAAPVIVVIAARPERTTLRYGRRAHRYVAMEAGHAAENLCLQAVALGLAAGIVGAFGDAEVRELLDSPAEEEPLYLLPAGRAAGARGA